MNKILILGANGMVGNNLFSYFSNNSNYLVSGTTRTPQNNFYNLEISPDNQSQLVQLLKTIKPEFVINCIGFIRPSDSFEDYQRSIIVNSLFPKQLAGLCTQFKIRLIHISTDCVFSGNKGKYSEHDTPDAQDIYGISKYLGEIKETPHLTIRTSVIGREKKPAKNLLDWFLTNQGDSVEGFLNVYWNGITTITLAKIIDRIITQNLLTDQSLVQIASETVSKYELLRLFNLIFSKNKKIIKNKSVFSNKTLVPSSSQDQYFKDIVTPLSDQISELKYFLKNE